MSVVREGNSSARESCLEGGRKTRQPLERPRVEASPCLGTGTHWVPKASRQRTSSTEYRGEKPRCGLVGAAWKSRPLAHTAETSMLARNKSSKADEDDRAKEVLQK